VRLGAEYGFQVDVVGDVQGGGRRVSSTWVRDLLAAGDVEGAARLLGRPHAVQGEVVHGLKRGRELGFPTANLSPDAEGSSRPMACTPGGSSTSAPTVRR
jgi:riboflavin kinase/FMN adenylyltransferase